MAKINWDKLEIEYLTTKTSYSKLAKKHDISVSSVEKYAIRNNWQKKRRQYCSEVKAKALARTGARDVDKLVKLQQSADSLADKICEIFEDDKQFRRHIISTTDKNGNMVTKEKVMKKVDSRAVKDITSAIRELTAATRNLYELYTEPENQKMDIETEKLQLMKDKIYQTDEEQEEFGAIEIAQILTPEEGEQGE